MKYIRLKDGTIYNMEKADAKKQISDFGYIPEPTLYAIHVKGIVSQANTIEELCDCFSYDIETTRDFAVARSWKIHNLEREIYGCIKTDKGLIYVAKMNEKGELELL